MNEKSNSKKNLNKYSTTTRNEKFLPKKIKTHNQAKILSQIFTNPIDLTALEERIDKKSFKKLIAMNNTSINKKFYDKKKSITEIIPKKLSMDHRAKLFYERNHLLNKNISTNIFSYSNKRNNSNSIKKKYYSYKNLSMKAEEKAKLIESDKILKIKNRIDKKNKDIQKFLTLKKLHKKQMKEHKELEKEKKELKIKMYKIINRNGKLCQNFIKKNESYNLRFINYLNSKDYINCKKLYSDNFHFSKNELNKGHDPFKQYLETDLLSKNTINIKDFFNSLNIKDKNYTKRTRVFL